MLTQEQRAAIFEAYITLRLLYEFAEESVAVKCAESAARLVDQFPEVKELEESIRPIL